MLYRIMCEAASNSVESVDVVASRQFVSNNVFPYPKTIRLLWSLADVYYFYSMLLVWFVIILWLAVDKFLCKMVATLFKGSRNSKLSPRRINWGQSSIMCTISCSIWCPRRLQSCWNEKELQLNYLENIERKNMCHIMIYGILDCNW